MRVKNQRRKLKDKVEERIHTTEEPIAIWNATSSGSIQLNGQERVHYRDRKPLMQKIPTKSLITYNRYGLTHNY